MAAPAVEGAAVTALRSVLLRARYAAERAGTQPERVRIVAVSKTKPNSLIRQVYDAGHRCFGENYVQEIVQKAPQLPEDIEWHFIGHLQSNKVKTLLGAVPNLALFEGVDNEKIANHLDRAVSSLGRNPLRVFVQVNTSGEASKSGIEPSACVRFAEYVKLRCPNLEFSGLMTIGMPDYTSTPENFRVMDSVAFKKEDAGFLQSDNDIKYFVNLIDNDLGHSSLSSDEQTLSNCRIEVCKALGITEDECELSMGMSSDFEQAIEMGSTNVRVGSTIFGPRDYSKKLPN